MSTSSATPVATANTAPLTIGSPAGRRRKPLGAALTILTWLSVIVLFFPVAWMFLAGFRSESDVATRPPDFFAPFTFEQYNNIFERGVMPYLLNSATVSLISVVLVLILAIPGAYALSIKPIPKWKDGLFFFLTTRMLPIAAAIAPIFILARDLHLLDTIWLLIMLTTVMNLPIAIWMMRSFLLEVPVEVIEAARVDGAGFVRTMRSVILPMLSPGIGACALICFIFSWNEFFLAVNLTTTAAPTMPVFLVGFITSEGQFWAQLSAAATICALPVIIAGWVAQDKLVRGLTLGAVK